MTDSEISMTKEDAIVQQGDEAEALLTNNTFTKTVDGLVQEVFEGFVNTAPEAKSEREQKYNHYRALVDIVHTLKQRVEMRDQLLEERNDSDINGD